MNLNNFETKLNTNTYTKDDVRDLLNYTFKLKARLEDREERLDLIREQRDITTEVAEENKNILKISKENIRINSINNKYDIAPWNDYKLTLIYVDVNFDYGKIYNANMRIDTGIDGKLLEYDEIKNKIIEEFNQ
jgi:hypothetical protein